MKCKVTVIIVTYNSDDTIALNLNSLVEGNEAGEIRVIVVDNNSSDETTSIVKENYPWVSLVESKENLGYGRGLNKGLDDVNTPYVLFMNPDAIFPYEEIMKLVSFMVSHKKVGMVAPAIKRRNGQYQEAGMLITPTTILQSACGVKNIPKTRSPIIPGTEPFLSNWLCGAIMLCPTDLAKSVSGFDSRFFLYFEETDLCVRIQKAGYELWANGLAVASHESNSSARKVDPSIETGGCLFQHFYPSRFYYLKKHHGIFLAFFTQIIELSILGGRDFVRFVLGKRKKSDFFERIKYPLFRFPKKIEN